MAFASSRKSGRATSAVWTSRQRLIKAAAVTLLLALCLIHLEAAFVEQTAYSAKSSSSGLAQYQNNPRALYQLGTSEYLFKSDNEKALHYFNKAIGTFSLYIPALIRKGEIEAEMGNTAQAMAISEYVDTIAPDSFQWRWDRTMLAYSLEQYDLLAQNLSWFIEHNLGKRSEALNLAAMVWQNPLELIEQTGIHKVPHILHFYIHKKAVEKARVVWQNVLEHNLVEEANALRYTNFLIGNNKITDAKKVWDLITPADNETRLTNPDFSHDITGSGFGWRLSRKHRTLFSGDNDVTAVNFRGDDNMRFNLRQLVAVEPGASYSLRLQQKASGLTTDKRPFWLVRQYKCANTFSHKSESMEQTTNWHDITLNFRVPEECNSLWGMLRRNTSYHFDNKIAGSLQFKDLSLTKVAPSPVSSPAALSTQ